MPRKLKRDNVERVYAGVGALRAEDLPYDADETISTQMTKIGLPTPLLGDTNKIPQSYFVAPDEFGDEFDGNVSTSAIINEYSHLTADVVFGSTTITVAVVTAAMVVGRELMLHQTQCFRDITKRFRYEFVKIESIDGLNITLTTGLQNGYLSDNTGDKVNNTMTQVVTVPNYIDLTLTADIYCGLWDGESGGILVFRAKTVTGSASLHCNGRGFRDARRRSPSAATDYYAVGEGPLGKYDWASGAPGDSASELKAQCEIPSPVTSGDCMAVGALLTAGGAGAGDAGNIRLSALAVTYQGSPMVVADFLDVLPMATASIAIDSNSSDNYWITEGAAGGIVCCFVETTSGYSGTVNVNGSGGYWLADAGGAILFQTPADPGYTGAFTTAGQTSGLHGVTAGNGGHKTGEGLNPAVKGWKKGPKIDQDLQKADTPEFAGLTLGGTAVDPAADVTADNAPQAHAASHTDGTDDIQSATNAQKGLATAAQITVLEAGQVSDGHLLGSGVVKGGFITVNGGNNLLFDVAAGNGYVVDNYTDPAAPVVTPVSWNAIIGTTPTGAGSLDTQFISIDSAGLLVQSATLPTLAEKRSTIYLGKMLLNPSTGVCVFGLTFPDMEYALSDKVSDIEFALGIVNIEGNVYTPNGANLSLDRSEGMTYRPGANYPNSYKTPSVITNLVDTLLSMGRAYRDGAGGYAVEGSLATTVNPEKWDDGTGTLADVPDGYWTIQNVYFFTNGNTFVTYGQSTHPSINQALQAAGSEEPDVNQQYIADASLRLVMVLKKGATSLQDTSSAVLLPTTKGGDISSVGVAAPVLDYQTEPFNSRATGIHYAYGFYDAPATSIALTQASTTQTHGSVNQPYGAHAFIVAAAIGSATGGTGAVIIKVTGTSVTDAGVRVAADTETIVADITAMATDDYFETAKKWVGQITFTLDVGATGHTAYAATFNYGLCKYEDWGNRKIKLTDFEIKGIAGAADTGVDIELLPHVPINWTYNATAFVPGDGALLSMLTDYGAESDLTNGEPFSYKRAGLSTVINGDANEGFIVRTTTGANNSIEDASIKVGVEIL